MASERDDEEAKRFKDTDSHSDLVSYIMRSSGR